MCPRRCAYLWFSFLIFSKGSPEDFVFSAIKLIPTPMFSVHWGVRIVRWAQPKNVSWLCQHAFTSPRSVRYWLSFSCCFFVVFFTPILTNTCLSFFSVNYRLVSLIAAAVIWALTCRNDGLNIRITLRSTCSPFLSLRNPYYRAPLSLFLYFSVFIYTCWGAREIESKIETERERESSLKMP